MGAEVIIVDDDPMVAQLTNDLLVSVGFSTRIVSDGQAALDTIRGERPRLVVLDIMIPGTDGLKILHSLKNDPETSGIKVIIASAKGFAEDKDRALQYGADAFLKKPYQIEELSDMVAKLLGPPQGTASPAETPKSLRLRVWGKSEPQSTSCLSLEGDTLLIFDAGKGLKELGEAVLQDGRHSEIWLILSHFHPDHVSGLGIFPCLHKAGLSLHIAGPSEPDKSLKALVEQALSGPLAPRSPITARLQIHELREDSYRIAGLRLAPFYANHPTTTLGFVIETPHRKIVHCPDSELYGDAATALQDYDEKLGRLCVGADLLIHDGRYSSADYESHRGSGHSSVENAALFAAANHAEKLLLFHPDPSYSETRLAELETEARDILKSKGAATECQVARDGLEIEL